MRTISSQLEKLLPAQKQAVQSFAETASSESGRSLETIAHVLKMSNRSLDTFYRIKEKIAKKSQVALHFHPDRLDATGTSVIQSIYQNGFYKSQFETSLSNGSLTAFEGGHRDLWEKELFGGAYHSGPFSALGRPKYGTLQLLPYSDGPSPRFGSCHFVLHPEVGQRCTFTWMDSHTVPKEKGTLDQLDFLLSCLLEESFTRNFALGHSKMQPGALMNAVENFLDTPLQDRISLDQPPTSNLDHYLEAQVHGPISLEKDVRALFVDPSFRETCHQQTFDSVCSRYDIQLFWTSGYSLSVDQVPDDFRGPKMPLLAQKIQKQGRIDAAILGQAAINCDKQDFYSLQDIKLLWHVLVKFGGRYWEQV